MSWEIEFEVSFDFELKTSEEINENFSGIGYSLANFSTFFKFFVNNRNKSTEIFSYTQYSY